jgi:hypothetical protein
VVGQSWPNQAYGDENMADRLQWEYRVESFGSMLKNVKDEELEASLNVWGEEGWEVVDIAYSNSQLKVMVVAKRPLSREARRQRDMPGSN